MTGPRMRQIHADAEEAHIRKKIKDSIEKIGRVFDRDAPWVDPTRSQTRVEKFRFKILQEISGVYGYRGYDPDSMPVSIQSLLNSSESSASSWKSLSYVTSYMPLGLSSLYAKGSYSAVAASVLTSGLSVAMARRTTYQMIRESVDALLIMDRIYYYDGKEINNEYIKTACLDHVKRRKEIDDCVYGPLVRLLCARYTTEKVKEFLREVIEKLRYKHTSTE